MNNTIHLDHDFEPPKNTSLKNTYLEALAPKHNDMDYDAWSTSKEELRGIFGPNTEWPFDVHSKEQNREDLAKHYREFEEKVAFAYTLLNKEKNLCVGCLYIGATPLQNHDARVDFWFRTSHRHLESDFFDELKIWLKTKWCFTKVVFPGRNMSWEDYNTRVEKNCQ